MPKASKPAATKRAAAKKNGALVQPRVITASITREDIARRAYELFEQSGGVHGRDIQHWLDAERQLLEHQ
jgi:hypothetical protein